MHDCRTIHSRLVDLVFDELQADEKRCLLAEVETCTSCLGEYRSVTSTLLVFDRAAEAAVPDESYWPEHREMLELRLVTAAPIIKAQRRDPLWRRILTARLPVPVPLAAVITLALLGSILLALRPSTTEAQATPQPTVAATAPPKVIEVPVFRERLVTRTVYVEKRQREKTEARSASPTPRREETTLTALHTDNESGEGGIFTRANLTGFQPPDELKIRIVKRSNLR